MQAVMIMELMPSTAGKMVKFRSYVIVGIQPKRSPKKADLLTDQKFKRVTEKEPACLFS